MVDDDALIGFNSIRLNDRLYSGGEKFCSNNNDERKHVLVFNSLFLYGFVCRFYFFI